MRLKVLKPGVLFARLFREPLPQMYSGDYIYSLLRRKHTHVWLIAPPKSGSTWLSALLENYLGWETMAMTDAYDRREQEPSLRLLAQSAPIENVLWKHQHTRASISTIELIRRAAILPIIQTRDIHDAVMSCIDHFSNESPVCSMAYMDDIQWNRMDADSKSRFIVEMVAPWYFNFYAGWFSSKLVRDATAYVCRYENLNKDPVGELIKICEHFGLSGDWHKAQAAVDRAASQFTRRNHGVIGRGANLSEELKASLARMRSYYPNIDFSAAGFPE
jgi:hypothetical protein